MQHPPYTVLAEVYDEIMADVDYPAWTEFLVAQAANRGVHAGPVLDLGCGTGSLTLLLADRGLQPTGLDSSAPMLSVAQRKGPHIRWCQADFTSFTVEGRFRLVVSVFDSLNNLLEANDFLAAARRVRAHLEPGGLFIFDVNTSAGLRELWDGGMVEGWAGGVYYRWRHSFDERLGLARVEAYCECGGRKFTEVHLERPYDPPELGELLAEAGFAAVEMLTFPDGEEATGDEERLWVVAAVPRAAPAYEMPPAARA